MLDKVELFVVADVVMSSTANYADIVLPACHYFECESASGESTKYVFYNAKAAEPLYESKSDFDIFSMLIEKMDRVPNVGVSVVSPNARRTAIA